MWQTTANKTLKLKYIFVGIKANPTVKPTTYSKERKKLQTFKKRETIDKMGNIKHIKLLAEKLTLHLITLHLE